jgi:hypothetical protein
VCDTFDATAGIVPISDVGGHKRGLCLCIYIA